MMDALQLLKKERKKEKLKQNWKSYQYNSLSAYVSASWLQNFFFNYSSVGEILEHDNQH